VASRRPDLSGADVLLRDEGERDALRDRHTEWFAHHSGRHERTLSYVLCSPTSAALCAGLEGTLRMAEARFLRVPAVRLQDC
jgi:hypothetical protein